MIGSFTFNMIYIEIQICIKKNPNKERLIRIQISQDVKANIKYLKKIQGSKINIKYLKKTQGVKANTRHRMTTQKKKEK